MPALFDQLNNKLQLGEVPQRIVSLVPSQSEFLWELGLQNELVGITKFCIHPDKMFRTITRVGGTKDLDLGKIRALKPDLIIGNKEENSEDQIRTLQEEFPVWMSDIYTFGDAFQMMQQLGEIVGKPEEAEEMVAAIQQSLKSVKDVFSGQKVLYFIWNEPYMVAGKNTFIHHVLDYLGLKNAAGHLDRYPLISSELLSELKPDFCFLSSEPYPFKEKHAEELRLLAPYADVRLVDGEMFSWYGSRLRHLAAYVNAIDL